MWPCLGTWEHRCYHGHHCMASCYHDGLGDEASSCFLKGAHCAHKMMLMATYYFAKTCLDAFNRSHMKGYGLWCTMELLLTSKQTQKCCIEKIPGFWGKGKWTENSPEFKAIEIRKVSSSTGCSNLVMGPPQPWNGLGDNCSFVLANPMTSTPKKMRLVVEMIGDCIGKQLVTMSLWYRLGNKELVKLSLSKLSLCIA